MENGSIAKVPLVNLFASYIFFHFRLGSYSGLFQISYHRKQIRSINSCIVCFLSLLQTVMSYMTCLVILTQYVL